MKFASFLCAVILVMTQSASAQKSQGIVSGAVTDSATGRPVADVTITVLNRMDSSLVSFTMTEIDGRFKMTKLSAGDYRLLFSHVNYHNQQAYFQISDEKQIVDIKNIMMHDLSIVLSEVILNSEAPPVTLIGDTIQYNAGSFRVQPNAAVEELLKKLPGVEVNKDGSITAQGENVRKVLVDGKEFFGNDPKMATKNLPADAIDKVQVFDRKSEQAQLTGFDDGNSEKTINLKLKEDKKKGKFGRAAAGAGTDNRYESKFNLNSFKGARQMSVIAMANNINSEGFSFMDILNFSGSLNNTGQSDGGSILLGGAQPGASGMSSNTEGIRTVAGSGINYNNIIGKKTSFTSNYFYNRYNPFIETNLQRQYFLKDSSYYNNRRSLSNNISNTHTLNLSADIQIDSFHSLKISPSLNYQYADNFNSGDYETLSGKLQRVNEGNSVQSGYNKGLNLVNDLLFRKKFRRRGRTFSLSLQNNFSNNRENSNLSSLNRFYNKSGIEILEDSIKQQRHNSASMNMYHARAAYTEPLFRRSLMEFSLAMRKTQQETDREVYDYDVSNDKYSLLNADLSNDFNNNYGYTQAGFRIRHQGQHFNYTLGAILQDASLEGKIIAGNKDSVIGQSYTNILPNFRFQYQFSRYKNLTLNYTTSTNQPTASQLQPVADNSNPLYLRTGNPELDQEFRHALQLNFTMLNPFRRKNLFAFITLSRTENKIVNYDVIDSLGIKTTTPVNVDGFFTLNNNLSGSLPIPLIKGSVSFRNNVFYSRGFQFINGTKVSSRTWNIQPRLSVESNISENLSMVLFSSFQVSQTRYSLTTAPDTRFLTQEYGGELNWKLPGKFYFATDFEYMINSQRASGFNVSVPLWNASLARHVLPFNRGEIKLRAFDLLNKNIGITRNATGNYIEDASVITVRRYFMLAFTYNLSKTAGSGAQPGKMTITM